MGDVVLDAEAGKDAKVRIYAHCAKGGHGAVALVALNTDPQHGQVLTLPQPAERLTITALELTSTKVLLNGKELDADGDGSVSAFHGDPVAAGMVRLPPASVTFLTIPAAGNKSCTP
jgi:hypothetical protein